MCVKIRNCFFSSRRRHTRWNCDWSSDVCSSDLVRRGQPWRGELEYRRRLRRCETQGACAERGPRALRAVTDLKMEAMTRALLGVLLLAAAGAAHGQVEARAPWVRGTVRGQTTAGAYMELTSDRRASLLGAESPAAGSAEIH